MPYIAKNAREAHANGAAPATPGELNYAITMLVDNYVKTHTKFGEAPSYSLLNEVIGVLECAKQEYYRRVVSYYEDRKIRENADVFGVPFPWAR